MNTSFPLCFSIGQPMPAMAVRWNQWLIPSLSHPSAPGGQVCKLGVPKGPKAATQRPLLSSEQVQAVPKSGSCSRCFGWILYVYTVYVYNHIYISMYHDIWLYSAIFSLKFSFGICSQLTTTTTTRRMMMMRRRRKTILASQWRANSGWVASFLCRSGECESMWISVSSTLTKTPWGTTALAWRCKTCSNSSLHSPIAIALPSQGRSSSCLDLDMSRRAAERWDLMGFHGFDTVRHSTSQWSQWFQWFQWFQCTIQFQMWLAVPSSEELPAQGKLKLNRWSSCSNFQKLRTQIQYLSENPLTHRGNLLSTVTWLVEIWAFFQRNDHPWLVTLWRQGIHCPDSILRRMVKFSQPNRSQMDLDTLKAEVTPFQNSWPRHLPKKTPDSWRRKTTDGVFHCLHMSSPAKSPPGVSLSCSVLFAWDHPNDGKCHNRNDLQPHGLCQQLTHLSAHWRKEVHDLAICNELQTKQGNKETRYLG